MDGRRLQLHRAECGEIKFATSRHSYHVPPMTPIFLRPLRWAAAIT